jgi:pseudouridine-5'-phosphate glycosidase
VHIRSFHVARIGAVHRAAEQNLDATRDMEKQGWSAGGLYLFI